MAAAVEAGGGRGLEEAARMSELKYRRISNLFPLMSGDQFQELVEDVKANGLRTPIVLFEGEILDGRNRYRACAIADVEPCFEMFTALVDQLRSHRRGLGAY